jgi:hypothetical protein
MRFNLAGGMPMTWIGVSEKARPGGTTVSWIFEGDHVG